MRFVLLTGWPPPRNRCCCLCFQRKLHIRPKTQFVRFPLSLFHIETNARSTRYRRPI